MVYELLKENKIWYIETYNYSCDYKKYFNENKIAMGLGSDINLNDIDAKKEIIGEYKSEVEKFRTIKKGDYIVWKLVDRINLDGKSYLQVSKIIGKVNKEFREVYEIISEIGHLLLTEPLEKVSYLLENTDKVRFRKMDDSTNEYKYFEKLTKFDEVKNSNVNKYYIEFSYFGLESINENGEELTINFDFCDNNEILELKSDDMLKEGTYILGEFISKKDKTTEVYRTIGQIKNNNLKDKKEIILEIISKEEKKYDYLAIIDINDETINNIDFINQKLIKSKNTILYGPPGTGKTYSIATMIIKTIKPSILLDKPDNMESIHNEVRKLQNDNRIKFCTFHQSYGYEEFIEGLRSDENGNFVLEDGILKEIAIEAMFEGLVEEIKNKLIEEQESLSEKELKQKKKELVLEYINQNNRFDFFNCNQYVIVIDEINRGNISKIFGELLTLLEEDKRLTKDNEMIIKLPYSKEDFTLPPNLHLIGTMNSSDKSIAPIDIALRRRFKFIEVMPNEELLGIVDGIDLKQMLKKINDRIEYLYDRDHMIGHAYFINNNSLEDIKETLSDKIIPLLQEYFYEDFDKIALVLGGIGNSKSDKYIIYREEINPENLFNNISEYDFSTINKYCIKDIITDIEIKSIYE